MKTDTGIGISMKTTTLLMLLAGYRVNTLTHLKLENMYLTDEECTFVFDEVLKHSRPNYFQKPIRFRAFPQNISLCSLMTIKDYLNYRLTKSNDQGFFIINTKPYKQCTPDTIARWIKTTMQGAGIDSGIFQPHSVRTASTSAAKRRGVPLSVIIDSANCSNRNTFEKHYNKELLKVIKRCKCC